MKLPCLFQPRILKEALRAIFRGPYTTEFPFKPHEPPEGFRGKPEFREKDCVACTACVQVCPTGALSYEDVIEERKAIRRLIYRVDLCIFCGQCQRNCLTEKGIILTPEFDLATTGKREDLKQVIEKELVLCEICNRPIASKEHILWVARRIGPRIYSNTSLLYFVLREKDLSQSAPLVERKDILRQDRVKFLCPHCRRESVLTS